MAKPKNLPSTFFVAGCFLAVSFLCPVIGNAQTTAPNQQATSPSPNQNAADNPQSGPTSEVQPSSDASAEPPVPVLGPAPSSVRALGGAAPLPTGRGPLSLGPLYVASFEAAYLGGDGLSTNPTTGQPVSGFEQAALFRGQIVLDETLGRARFALQYQPMVLVLNGAAQNDLTNQAVSVNTDFQIAPRWSIGIADSYNSSNNSFTAGDFYFHADPGTGAFTQNTFVQQGERLYSNQAGVSFNYQIDPVNTLVIRPFTYFYRLTAPETADQTDLDWGAQVEWNHLLTPTRAVGFSYGYQDRQFTGSDLPDVSYNQAGIHYSEQLRRSLYFSSSVLFSVSNDSLGRAYSAVGNFSVTKSFHKSEIDFSFYRGNDFNGYLNNGYINRVDGNYGFRLGRNLQMAIGGGRFAGSDGTTTGNYPAANYAVTQANYQLSAHWFASANYGHRWQNGDAFTLPVGGNNFGSVGISWRAVPETRMVY